MKTVKWNPTSNLASQVLSQPKPARNYQPDWYKKLSAFFENRPTFSVEGTVNKTLKHCQPFADSLNAGYIMETWQDIHFSFSENGEYTYSFPTDPPIIATRDRVSMDMGQDFYPIEFVFHSAWMPELPKGWSMLYVHPLNRPELPFFVPSGIIDSDKYVVSSEKSSLPFYMKKGFSGILPAGTPLMQLIPIKREDWVSKKMPFDEAKRNASIYKTLSKFWGGYKKHFWSKKSYK
jgi:hypothetical protein